MNLCMKFYNENGFNSNFINFFKMILALIYVHIARRFYPKIK